MLKFVTETIVLWVGALLCGAVIIVASRRYRQDGDVKKLLASLVAAIVALVSGFVTQLVVASIILQWANSLRVTDGNVLAACLSSLVSAPVIVEALNVAIVFYPFYLIGSFAIAAVLLFYGGRMFTRTWSRLSFA